VTGAAPPGEVPHEGGCLCGGIRYRVTGAPRGTNLCHCTQCRRQTGAMAPAFVTFALARFELLGGAPRTYRASPRALRQFCPDCGSTLFWRRDGGDEVDVFVGTLDDPAAMPPPAVQIWTAHRLPWLLDLAQIPAYPERRPRTPD
jgi:hypothetical protein